MSEDKNVGTPKRRQRIVRESKKLARATGELCDSLGRFEEALLGLAALVERGEPGIAALTTLHADEHRQEVMECFDNFEAARHQLRLAAFALCQEEGANLSEIGRALGFSRQLASRLAAEAEAHGY